jgi:glycosyltransferase involved in cell wall biosynthesis
MKILRVITSMDPSLGGPSQGIRNSIPEFQKLGAYSEVVSMDDSNALFLGNDNFKINTIGAAQGPWQSNKNLIPWLVTNLARFDAVIVHGLWLYHTYAVHKALKTLQQGKNDKQNIPKMFVMPHGMLDPYFQKAQGRKLKAIRNWLYWKLVEGKILNNADGILFTCEEELRLARETFSPYHPQQEINIGYGISQPPAFKVEMQQEFLELCPQVVNNPYILFLSRIHEKKGVDLLINAYKQLLTESNGTIMPKLVIAGPGLETPFGKEMRQLGKGYEDSILFPGMLTGNKKWGAIYGCDVFVLPSHQENFGISVAEALACSKPVLISNQVNIWREMEGGAIVSSDTFEGTKSMLSQWLSMDTEDKQAMAQKAHYAYERNFESFPAAKKFLEAIS